MPQRVARSDVPALLIMAAIYFAFGLFAIFRPGSLRHIMDNLADYWKAGTWHPFKMPRRVLQILVGGLGILVALLFSWIAWAGLGR